MIASFASAGFVALVPALAVMLGANVGTTLIVQALWFDVSRLSPLLLLSGVVFRAGGSRTRDIGRTAIGLGFCFAPTFWPDAPEGFRDAWLV